MLDGILWLFQNLALGIVNLVRALAQPQLWLDWSNKEAVGRFIYYGGSVEFFFVVFDIFLIVLLIGLWKRQFLWNVVRGIEAFSNTIGRFAAWAGLIMVLQQVMVVFLQRIFLVAQIEIAPFGVSFSRDLSWWTEELKLYNAILVSLCCAYTFVQGGHVRVDLFYAGVSHRAKRVVDMFGSLFFIMPTMVITWLFGWFFLWRHLVTPKVNTTDQIETVLRKTKLMKWNVETIGFSPSGFDAYFLFKVLLVAFAGMMFLAGCAYFYRALLEYLEGEESAGKYLDKDSLEDDVAEKAAEIH